MKVTIDASPEELAQEAEMLRAHVDELLTASCCSLRKAQGPNVKGQHPARAIRDMAGLLQDRYDAMLEGMNKAILDYLASQVGQEPT